MLGYITQVIKLYKKELQQDRELLEGLIQEWILIPRDITMHTYMAMYGILGCIARIALLLLVRIPVWWPMHILAYLINCTVRYTFVPLFAFIHILLNKAQTDKSTLALHIYEYVYTVLEWLEWILKTVFLLTYTVDKIVLWLHNRRSVRGYIDYKIDQIVVKAHILRNQKQKQGRLSKLWIMISQGWTNYVSPVPRLILRGIRVILRYINPLNYTWVKYVVYPKYRRNLIVIIKCRLIIRFAIFKGLVRYGVKKWVWIKLRRWGRNTTHILRVMCVKYHPKLAVLNIGYWTAFHSWWIASLTYRYMYYFYVYMIGGIKWLSLCAAIISSPILYVLLQLLYIINACKIWYTHGLWISKSYFYLMVGWNTNISYWKWHTRIR